MNLISAKFDKEGNLTLVLKPTPRVSQSAKTVLVASTGGFVQTAERWSNLPLSISVNATVPNTREAAAACGQ